MGLWSKNDNIASIPKYIDLTKYPAGTRLVLVDTNEANIATNKARGLSSPGWWLYREENRGGNIRRFTELLVSFAGATTVSVGDTGVGTSDDNILSDVAITFTTQPTNQTAVAGNATFSVVATPTPTSYQWQVSTDSGATWSNISGQTTDTLALTGLVVGDNGKQYRVVADRADSDPATSNAATLTVTA